MWCGLLGWKRGASVNENLVPSLQRGSACHSFTCLQFFVHFAAECCRCLSPWAVCLWSLPAWIVNFEFSKAFDTVEPKLIVTEVGDGSAWQQLHLNPWIDLRKSGWRTARLQGEQSQHCRTPSTAYFSPLPLGVAQGWGGPTFFLEKCLAWRANTAENARVFNLVAPLTVRWRHAYCCTKCSGSCQNGGCCGHIAQGNCMRRKLKKTLYQKLSRHHFCKQFLEMKYESWKSRMHTNRFVGIHQHKFSCTTWFSNSLTAQMDVARQKCADFTATFKHCQRTLESSLGRYHVFKQLWNLHLPWQICLQNIGPVGSPHGISHGHAKTRMSFANLISRNGPPVCKDHFFHSHTRFPPSDRLSVLSFRNRAELDLHQTVFGCTIGMKSPTIGTTKNGASLRQCMYTFGSEWRASDTLHPWVCWSSMFLCNNFNGMEVTQNKFEWMAMVDMTIKFVCTKIDNGDFWRNALWHCVYTVLPFAPAPFVDSVFAKEHCEIGEFFTICFPRHSTPPSSRRCPSNEFDPSNTPSSCGWTLLNIVWKQHAMYWTQKKSLDETVWWPNCRYALLIFGQILSIMHLIIDINGYAFVGY